MTYELKIGCKYIIYFGVGDMLPPTSYAAKQKEIVLQSYVSLGFSEDDIEVCIMFGATGIIDIVEVL